MLNVTIDGISIQVPEGTTVLRAAQMAGVQIPTLCDHPKLTPYGGCRLCLVEVEGARTLQPSCTMPATNNMVVRTSTEKVKTARKFVLTLIFSERNHFCPFCQVTGGDCELQNAALAEGMSHWTLQPNWQPYTVDASHPYFVLDNNRCILCRRCVRACAEMPGNFTLGFEERGANSFLVADLGVPLGESSCVSCGSCVQVCPTGALIERRAAYQGHDELITHTPSLCVGCSVGCGVDVLTRDNRLVSIDSLWDAPVNEGVLCKTGRFLPVEEDRERIVTPLVRKNGSLKAATWEEALGVISSHLKPLAGKKDSVAALVSTRLPAEALIAFKQLFGEQMRSDMVTSIEEGQPTALTTALAQSLGKAYEASLLDLRKADCVLSFAADLSEEHQVAGFFVKRGLPNGTKLIVVDSEENKLAALADVVLTIAKGSEEAAVLGLTAAAIKAGLVNNQPANFNAETALKEAAEKTKVAPETFMKAAVVLGQSSAPIFVHSKALANTSASPKTLKALVDLAQWTHAGVLSLKGKANSVAAAKLGLEKVFEPKGYQAVYLALGDDEPSKHVLQSIESAPFKVVQASYVSAASAMADVVLPVEMWAEQAGSYLNLEGKLQKAVKVLDAPEDVRSNLATLEAVAAQLGFSVKPDGLASLSQVSAVAIAEA